MRISNLKTFVMGVPGRNWIFVKIETDEGIYGWGEATFEWHEPAVVEGIKLLTPFLVGQDPTCIERIWQTIFRHHWWRLSVTMTSALSGIDQALWDITGKAFGQPVYRLLGGACQNPIRLYPRKDLGLKSAVEEALVAHEEGFTALKTGVKIGPQGFDEKEQIRQIVEECNGIEKALGREFEIMLDLQGVFSYHGILDLSQQLAGRNIVWLEEPVPALTIETMARLSDANLGIKLACGERLCSRWGFKEVLEKGVADIIQPDVCHTGGISELRRIAAYAEIFGVPVAPHNPLGPVAMAASVHTAAAMPNFLILEYCRRSPLFKEVQKSGIRIVEGYAEVPARPGLGIELDEELIVRYPYQPMPSRLWVRTDGSIPLV